MVEDLNGFLICPTKEVDEVCKVGGGLLKTGVREKGENGPIKPDQSGLENGGPVGGV